MADLHTPQVIDPPPCCRGSQVLRPNLSRTLSHPGTSPSRSVADASAIVKSDGKPDVLERNSRALVVDQGLHALIDRRDEWLVGGSPKGSLFRRRSLSSPGHAHVTERPSQTDRVQVLRRDRTRRPPLDPRTYAGIKGVRCSSSLNEVAPYAARSPGARPVPNWAWARSSGVKVSVPGDVGVPAGNLTARYRARN